MFAQMLRSRFWRPPAHFFAEIEQGYVRDGDVTENGLAVRWWYVHRRDDGLFARGGRVAKAREARRQLELAKAEDLADRELYETLAKPRYQLDKRGELRLIPRDSA